MQLWINSVEINEIPRFLEENKAPNSHTIVIDDPDPTSNATVILPLSLSGVTSYLTVHKPSLEDWDSGKYPWYELTSEHLDWNPSDPTFWEQEDDVTNDVGSFVDRYDPSGDPNIYIRAISSSVPQANISNDDNLGNVLMNKVQVSDIARDISTSQTTKTGNVTVALLVGYGSSGVTSYLPVHKLLLEDWDSGKYPWYELTSEHLDWNPIDPTFGEQEDDATDYVGSCVDRYDPAGDPNLYIRAISSSVPQANISDDDNLGNVLMNKVQV